MALFGGNARALYERSPAGALGLEVGGELLGSLFYSESLKSPYRLERLGYGISASRHAQRSVDAEFAVGDDQTWPVAILIIKPILARSSRGHRHPMIFRGWESVRLRLLTAGLISPSAPPFERRALR